MCPFKAYLQCDFYEIKNITSCQCELEHQNKKKYRLAYNFMFITGSKNIKNQHLLQGWNTVAYLANNQTEIEIENTHSLLTNIRLAIVNQDITY